MKKLLALTLAALLVLPMILGAAACASRPTLNILIWGDYIDPALRTRFERANGVRINEVTMESNELMLAKLREDDSDIDLCFPSDYAIEKLLAEGLLAPLNKENIPNRANIGDTFWALTESFDPGAVYSVPYMWGTLGILYDTTKVTEPVESWSILWDEQYSGQILMYDSERDSMCVALSLLGYDINTTDETEINAARDALIAQRPLVRRYGTDELKTDLVNGVAAMAVVYSGDAMLAMAENENLDYAVPLEGSNLWIDNMIIPKNAKNKELAEQFINFLCDAEVGAQNAEYIGYSTPLAPSLELLGSDYIDDEVFNPPAEIMDRCKGYHNLDEVVKIIEDKNGKEVPITGNDLYRQAWEAVLQF
ncbi:MAG: spermidine/putrescine ABC transporter substrate-binding protein [Clostridiales bacterium]|nr:spermidine/putrescine ABC transporter substrate-binding protein [Clostridiales bacterium]